MEKTQFRIELEQRIADEIAETKKAVDALEEITKPVGLDRAVGRLSSMDALQNKSVNDEALRMSRDKLQRLYDTQARLNEPDFGICKACGKAIPVERILLVPESRVCVECKQRTARR